MSNTHNNVSPFRKEKIEAQRGRATCLRLPAKKRKSQNFNPGSMGYRDHV